MEIEDRITALEAEVFCVVRVTEHGYVMETGCGGNGNYEDWSDKERCTYCGKKLKGHDDVKEII